jgi:hypothetical protein
MKLWVLYDVDGDGHIRVPTVAGKEGNHDAA